MLGMSGMAEVGRRRFRCIGVDVRLVESLLSSNRSQAAECGLGGRLESHRSDNDWR